MNEESTRIRRIKAIDKLINCKLLYQVFDFAKSITTDSAESAVQKAFWNGAWCNCGYCEETIQSEYGFRYFGEMLERFDERIGSDIKTIRTLAVGFSLVDSSLPNNAYVSGQRDKFIKLLEKNSSDFVIDYALQIINNEEIDTYIEFDSTEKLVLALSMSKDFSEVFEKLKPQITKLFGADKTISVEDNSGIFDWLTDRIYSNDISLKKKDDELFKVLLVLGNKFLKSDSREVSVLKKYGFSELDVAYLTYCFVGGKSYRCRIKPNALAGEKVAVDFVLKHLNSERTHTESTYRMLRNAFRTYSRFDIKCNGHTSINDAIEPDVEIINPYTFSKFSDELGYGYFRQVDFFDEKWDSLAKYMTEEAYEELVVDIIYHDNPNKSKMQKYMSRYHKNTGKRFVDIFKKEYCHDKAAVMNKMAALGIIDLWKWFEKALTAGCKVKMKYLEKAVFGYKNKVGFEFWLKFFNEYKMRDLDAIFSDDKKDFVSFVDDNRFHSLSGKRFNFRVSKLDLTEEQMKTYLKWAEEYFFEFRTEDYLDFVQSMLIDKDTKALINFDERKAMYDILIKYRPELAEENEVRNEYLTQKELDAIRMREQREKEKEDFLKNFKEKSYFEECFRKVYNGTYESVSKFIDDLKLYSYGKYKKAKIKPLFLAMLRKREPTSKKEFESFIEICNWLAEKDLLSYEEMKKILNGTEA